MIAKFVMVKDEITIDGFLKVFFFSEMFCC